MAAKTSKTINSGAVPATFAGIGSTAGGSAVIGASGVTITGKVIGAATIGIPFAGRDHLITALICVAAATNDLA